MYSYTLQGVVGDKGADNMDSAAADGSENMEYDEEMDCNCGGRFAYDHLTDCMVCESCGCDPDGETVWPINILIQMSCKGSSEAPLYFEI